MMKLTVQEFSDKFAIDKTAAYGLVNILAAKGLIKCIEHRKEPGKRGQGAAVYEFDSFKVGDALRDMFYSVAPDTDVKVSVAPDTDVKVTPEVVTSEVVC